MRTADWIVAMIVASLLLPWGVLFPAVRRRRGPSGTHPSYLALEVPAEAFTASNGLAVRIAEQEPGMPPLLQVYEEGILRFTIQAPHRPNEIRHLRRMIAKAKFEGDATHPQSLIAIGDYLHALDVEAAQR